MKKTSKLHYGWILCFASCLMLTGGAGIIINSANQFLTPVTEAFGVSRGQFSFYISCISITSMIVSPFIGKIFTKFPPKRVTIFGGLLMVLCWLGLSVANNIYLFYVLGLLIGTGSSLTGMVCVSILMNNWFVERKGTAMGIALTGTGIGSMIFNPVASKLIVECGYQAAYRWLGLICILALLPYMLLFRYQPSEIGASPLGAENQSREKESKKEAPLVITGLTRAEAMKRPEFYGICFIAFALSGACQGLYQHMTAYFTDIGYEQVRAASFIGIVGFTLAVGKIGAGWLTDKIGLQKCYILLVGLSTLGIVLLNFSTVGAIAILSSFLFGFAMAAPFVLAPLLTTFAFGAKDFADIYGTVTIFTFLGPILMPTLSGMIYDQFGSYFFAFVVCGVIEAASLVIGVAILKSGGYEKLQAANQV